MPRTALFWRSAAEVTDILTAPSKPAVVQFDDYVPEPCLIDPEQVIEYPHSMKLSKDLQERLGQWDTWQAAGVTPDSSYAPAPQEFYENELSIAPGWKVRGWAPWGLTDPIPRFCPNCGAAMQPLLTIATTEWDDATRSWIPYENQATASGTGHGYPDPSKPTAVHIGRGYNQQLYYCPVAPEHPHTECMQ